MANRMRVAGGRRCRWPGSCRAACRRRSGRRCRRPSRPCRRCRPPRRPRACGNMSETVVNRFADQAWCAAPAMPISTTAPTSLARVTARIGSTAHGEDQHRGLARAAGREAAPDQVAGQPAAHDAEHRDDAIDRDQVDPALLDVQAARLLEVVGQPDEEEPPDRIGQELADDERPRLPVAEDREPGELRAGGATSTGCEAARSRRRRRIAADVRQLLGREPPGLLRRVVEREPEEEPGEARACPATTNAERQPQVAAIQGTNAGAITAPTLAPELKSAVASARSFLGNQSATALMADGKLPPSPSPSATRAAQEAGDAADQRVPDRRQAPGRDRDRVADLGADAVDERAEQQQPERVRRPERRR